jgi:hypothetical protein
MVVPPGNRSGSDSQGSRPEDARLPAAENRAAPEAGSSAPEGPRDRETKRMPSRRSKREGWQFSVLSRLTSFPACLAAGRACGLSRLCASADLPASGGADHPCPTPFHRGSKPLPQRSSSPSLQLGERDGHIRRRSRGFVHDRGYHSGFGTVERLRGRFVR